MTACIRTKISAPFIIMMAMIVSSAPALASYASLIMDASNGRILHETNADLTRYPASLTKMMTLYLLFDALDRGLVSLDDMLPISAYAASQPPSKLGLRPGQSISVENAILALVTKSANDIATVVAEHLAGSEARFAWSMTAKAHEIGMSRTNFTNASGLPDPVQVSTARDLAILGLALLHDYPHYYHYFGTDRFHYGGAVHANHNRLLGSYPGLDGIKTGYTASSGFNLVASATRDGQRLIGVVLGARSPAHRSVIMADLLDQAFNGGEIIEVRGEEPMPPMQVQTANAPLKREPFVVKPRAGVLTTRSARVVRSTRVSTTASIKAAKATRQSPRSIAGKLASLPKVTLRSVIGTSARPRFQSRGSTRPSGKEPSVIALNGASVTATTRKRQSQVKKVVSRPQLTSTRMKISSASDASKLRVADGGRRRSL